MEFESKYDLLEDLGKGMFGVVKKCCDKETGHICAAKIVRKTKKTTEDALREISMMKLLKHDGLAQIFESFETQRQIIIVMEFIPGKELFAKVTEEEVFSEKTAVMYLKQMLLGIQHMHRKYIVHLDIKPENIICKPGEHPGIEDVKLIDFGLAREVGPGSNISALCGTPEFVAPEVLSYDRITVASDMWSLGVITYVLLSGISPFLGDSDAETLGYVTCGDYDFDNHPETFDNVSEDAKSFIEDLLEVNPRDRNTVDQCLDHPWIKKGGAENLLTTSKLKTFNAKRKWQKTINAVRAVGRFAFLNRIKNLVSDSTLEDLKNKGTAEETKTENTTEKSNGLEESLAQESSEVVSEENTGGSSTDKSSEDQTDDISVRAPEVSVVTGSNAPEITVKFNIGAHVEPINGTGNSKPSVVLNLQDFPIAITLNSKNKKEQLSDENSKETSQNEREECKNIEKENEEESNLSDKVEEVVKEEKLDFEIENNDIKLNFSENNKEKFSKNIIESKSFSTESSSSIDRNFTRRLSSRLKALSNRQYDLDEDFRTSPSYKKFDETTDFQVNNFIDRNNNSIDINNNNCNGYIMESNKYLDRNGKEENGFDENEEHEEAKDEVSPLETPPNGTAENGTPDDQKVAFKNWYRRASTSKTLTAVQQKSLESSMQQDIPIFSGDNHSNGTDTPKSNTSSNGSNTPKSDEEQKVLEAISRRLSIQTAEAPKQSPTAAKTKLGSIRRGSVPQARALKGNVKNRMAAFEGK